MPKRLTLSAAILTMAVVGVAGCSAADPDGPYGRYAYGLSGSANRAEQFHAVSGVVAIHGLPAGTEAGSDIPTGSLGVAADALDRMVSDIGVPLGTPVLVTD